MGVGMSQVRKRILNRIADGFLALHDGETSVNWCVADREGTPVEHERVAREIAADVGESMRP